jgi:predicted transcriptional regulator
LACECQDACLIFDDTIQKNNLNGLNVVCVGIMTTMPVAFEVIRNPTLFSDIATRKVKCANMVTKNEIMRQIVGQCIQNQLKFLYVQMYYWFVAKENVEFILKKNKHFVAASKNDRVVALSLDDKKQGRLKKVSELDLSDKRAVRD